MTQFDPNSADARDASESDRERNRPWWAPGAAAPSDGAGEEPAAQESNSTREFQRPALFGTPQPAPSSQPAPQPASQPQPRPAPSPHPQQAAWPQQQPPQWQHLGAPLRGPDYVPGAGLPGPPPPAAPPGPPPHLFGPPQPPQPPHHAPPGQHDTAVLPPMPPRRGRVPRTIAVVALVAALIGAVVGSVTGVVFERNRTQNTAAGKLPAGPLLPTGGPAPTSSNPQSVAAIAAKLLPSVVTIRVSNSTEEGTGSGVIIRSDGFILTNNHVVEPAAGGGDLRVDLYQGRHDVSAKIIGRDPKTDLAVIRIDGDKYPAAVLGQSSSLVVGAPVVALGAPLGLSSTVTSGIVSALDRNVEVPGENNQQNLIIGAIQTDAAINPGNSGGPLVDAAGQVVGINSAIASAPGSSGEGGNIGVGFAIPIDYARSVAEEIIRTGKATHPYLGVTASTIDSDAAHANGTQPGAQVQSVVPDGPADRAGMRQGDVITKVNDKTIDSVDDLVAATRLHKIGDVVTVTYVRDGQTKTVKVTLQESKG